MKWSLNLGAITGIKIRVHWTFLILLGWIAVAQFSTGRNALEVATTIAFILTIFGCVVLHELGHALMAKRYRINTKDILLLPIGGIASLEKIPEEPTQELWIALAGPAVNVVIAGILFAVTRLAGFDYTEIQPVSYSLSSFIMNLMGVNLFLAVFNMIPAFPMDGGRIFRALMAMMTNRARATKIASSLGQIIAMIFVFVGLFYNPFLIFIGIVVYLGALFESRQTQANAVLSDYKVKDGMMTENSILNEDDNLSVAVDKLLNGQAKEFLVMNDGHVSGILTRDHIIKGLNHQRKNMKISEIMQTEFGVLSPDMAMTEAYQMMQSKGYEMLPVVENNKLEGTLDIENVMEFILVKTAREQQHVEEATQLE